MRKSDAPFSTPGLAGIMMAMLAVAATAAAVPAPIVTGGECRVAMRESQPMRAVAAVVAAACDLLGIERANDIATAPLPYATSVDVPQRAPVIERPLDAHLPAPPLRDSLLNLPPPIC